MVALLEPFILFTPEECEEIITAAQATELRTGRVYAERINTNVRNNNIYWIEWPYDGHEFHEMFQRFPEYPVTWVQHPIQVSRYNPGERYDWHPDRIENGRSSWRSLTLTCTLQTAQDARFETRDRVYDLGVGEAVIFPSALEHRATAPSTGTRWSFTVWGMCPRTTEQ